jgi:hypothetical protein
MTTVTTTIVPLLSKHSRQHVLRGFHEGNSGGYMGGTIPIETPPTATWPELGVADVADEDQSATQLNLEYHDTSGGSGGSGGSLGAKNEFLPEVTI